MNRVLQVVLTGNSSSLRAVLRASAAEVKSYTNEVERSNRSIASSAKESNKALTALKGGATALAVALGFSVVKAAEFDRSMRNVNSLAGLGARAYNTLSQQVLAMSTRLPQSAHDLAEGLYDVVSSGFTAADGLTVLNAAATAASAGITTTAVSVKAISAVLNAYGLKAKDAGDVSDTLFQTVNLGVLSFDDLASSVGDVVGAAAAAKISIAGVGAAIATMTLTGISGAESATSLNQLIQSMIKPSDALAGAFKQLGYESGAQALEVDGLRGVMEKLRQMTGGNITALLQYFPNIRAARGALALMANEGQNYARVSAQIEDKNKRAGATQRVLNEQMKAAANQFQLLKNQAEEVAIQVGLKTLPILVGAGHALETLGSLIGHVASATGHALNPTWHALAQIGALVWHALSQVGDAAGTVLGVLLKLGGAAVIATLNGILSPIGSLAHLVGGSTPLTWAFVAAMAALALSFTSVQVAANRFILTPVVLGLTNMIGAAGSLAGLLTGGLVPALTAARIAVGKLAAATVLLGVVAVIADQVSEIKRMATSGDDARDAIKGMNKELADTKGNSPRFGKMSDQVAELKKRIADARGVVKQWNSESKLSPGRTLGLWGPSASDVHGAKDAMRLYQKQLDETWNAQRRFGVNTSDLSDRFRVSQDAVIALADKYKIDLSGSIDAVQFRFARMRDIDVSQGGAKRGTEDLIKALGTMADSTQNETDKLKALKEGLDALGGKTVDVFTAQSQLQAVVDGAAKSIEGMHGAVLDANGGLNAYTEAGRAAGGTLTDIADKGNNLIESLVKQGANLDTVKAKDAELRGSFIKSAEAMGIGADAANKLADQILGVPSDRETQFKALISGAAADIQRLQQQIDSLKGKTVSVGVGVRVTYDDSGNVVRRIFGGGFAQQIAQRHGGVWLPDGTGARVKHFAQGGIQGAVTPVPKGAMIARDGADLWHWAERGTGGEAFIPLGHHARRESKKMVAYLADLFGGAAHFASGGTTTGVNPASLPSYGSSGGSVALGGRQVVIHSVVNFTGPVYGADGMRRIAEDVVARRDATLARNVRSAR